MKSAVIQLTFDVLIILILSAVLVFFAYNHHDIPAAITACVIFVFLAKLLKD